MPKKILITTAIDYTNDIIHIGHAYQKVLADCLARYHRLTGDETFFLTGTDEHGLQSQQAAGKRGITPKELVDEVSQKNKEQLDALNVSYDRFIRTTDEDHQKVVADFWQKVAANKDEKGNFDIYLSSYSGWYCAGCEAYKTEKEIIESHCVYHPTLELEKTAEQNYFFRWSRYQDFLKSLISDNPQFVIPQTRKNEMLSFLDEGLEDIPISRPKDKIYWGIEVPNDPLQVIYVWFDALINYITGAPRYWEDSESEISHILGKDNTRWHALLWPAMLKSAGYRMPSTVYSHGFMTLNSQKISKTRGNIIRPSDLVEQFGCDAVRYYLLRYGPIIEDVDITLDKIKEIYNSDLANGLGNLVARVEKLLEWHDLEQLDWSDKDIVNSRLFNDVSAALKDYRVDRALEIIWLAISGLDKYLAKERPWEIKDIGEQKKILWQIIAGGPGLTSLKEIALSLEPFMPKTSQEIKKRLEVKRVKKGAPLFPRIT